MKLNSFHTTMRILLIVPLMIVAVGLQPLTILQREIINLINSLTDEQA